MEDHGHPGHVAIGTVTDGHDLSFRYVQSRMLLDMYDRQFALNAWDAMGRPDEPNPVDLQLVVADRFQASGVNIVHQRNKIVRWFLEDVEDAEWLWFLDGDMVFEPDTLHRLTVQAKRNDLKILGGLCVMIRATGCVPTLYIDNPEGITSVLLDYPDDQIAQVAATGTGCLLVHRDVFEAMHVEYGHHLGYFSEDIHQGSTGVWRNTGEDVSFCLRAGHLGFTTNVDTTLHIGHHKGVKVYYPEDARKTPCKPEDFLVDA